MWRSLGIVGLVSVLGCASRVSETPRDASLGLDVAADVAADAPVDARRDVVRDRPPPGVPDAFSVLRDASAGDVDPTCPAGALDRCPTSVPGPCADLNDGREHIITFPGFSPDHALSCGGRDISAGPDAVVPLTLTETSDVDISAQPGTNDSIAVALRPADQCDNPAWELECVNGGSSIGGIATFRASRVPPGDYVVILATTRGVAARVNASLRPARPRAQADVCPGVEVEADGPEVTIDTTGYVATADHGTTCGSAITGGSSGVDAVFRWVLDEPRDVIVHIEGEGSAALALDVSSTCGSRAQAIPGCSLTFPTARRLRSLRPGTYYGVLNYRAEGRPNRVFRVSIETLDPTPPGPAAVCPGVMLTEGLYSAHRVEALGEGPVLPCVRSQLVSGNFSFEAPAQGDVVIHAQTDDERADAALQLRATCGGEPLGECAGPETRRGNSIWQRFQGLTPGQRYWVQGVTSTVDRSLGVAYRVVPHADPRDVVGNDRCESAFTVPETGGVFRGSTDGSTAIAMPSCASGRSGCAGGRGVMYRLELSQRRRVVALMRASGFDTLLALQSNGPCPGTAGQGACNDDWRGTDSQIDVTVDAGTHWIYAAGCGADQSGDYTLDVMVVAP
ncbi:MAG: hypothetical protein R3A48_28760 [Polyangiales bacterium]